MHALSISKILTQLISQVVVAEVSDIRDLEPLFGDSFWCCPITGGRADCMNLSAVEDYRIVNPEKCSLVLKYSVTFQMLSVSFQLENRKKVGLPSFKREDFKDLELKQFWDVQYAEYVTVIKVEYSATEYQTKTILKNGKYSGKRKSAAVTIAWALSENEEDCDGNSVAVEDVSNDMHLLRRHCYPYEASDFDVPSGTIPHNGSYSIPPLTPALLLPKRLRRDKSDLAKQLKKCILHHGGPPKLMDGSTDPATGKVVKLSWIMSELAKVVEDETATDEIIHSQMINIIGWFTEEHILEGFQEMFQGFEYPMSMKYTKSQFCTSFLRWVASVDVSSSSTRTTTTSMANSSLIVVQKEDSLTTLSSVVLDPPAIIVI